MTSKDLTKEQAWQLHRGLGKVHVYLIRLARRMEHTGFSQDDPLCKLVRDAVQGLYPLTTYVTNLMLDRGEEPGSEGQTGEG